MTVAKMTGTPWHTEYLHIEKKIQEGIKEDVNSILKNVVTVLNPLVMVIDVLDLHTVCSIKNDN